MSPPIRYQAFLVDRNENGVLVCGAGVETFKRFPLVMHVRYTGWGFR
jgi:hypothetical protein